MTTPTTAKIHPFEDSGLGLAPFRCIGYERRVGPIKYPDGTEIGAPGQPMGSCAHCGTGIADCYVIRSADGKRFVVGSSCVLKTDRDAAVGLTDLEKDVIRFKREADREKREIKRQAKYEKDVAETQPLVAAAREALAADATLFAGEAHPQIRGLTLRDKYEWMLANAGFDGKKATARVILRAAEKKASNGAAV